MSKLGFPRSTPVPPPAEIKPEPVALHPPLKVPPPEGRPVWIVIVAILVIGLIGGVVWISFASGARTFSGGYAFFPILMVVGVLAMLFGGRFGSGNTQQMSRGKMDSSTASRWTAPLTGWTPTTAGIIRSLRRWNRRWAGRGCGSAVPWARTSGSGWRASGWV